MDDDELESELREILGEKSPQKPKPKAEQPTGISEEELMRQLEDLDVTDLPPLPNNRVAHAN